MNKTALRKFALQAREKLTKAVKLKAHKFGFNEDGTFSAEEFSDGLVINGAVFGDKEEKQYRHLKNRILLDGYDAVIEEAIYTWFNRLVALRYMEVNDYLPINMRILSSSVNEKDDPDALKNITQLIEELRLNKERIYLMQDNNERNELYQYLLVHQCNILGEALPSVFGRISEDIGLLLPDQLLAENSVLSDLTTTINEEDWRNVEIVGWLYQFYVVEEKDAFFANKSKKAGKAEIGPATQLFTPKWIVQYMVDNSLGRYWLEHHPDEQLKSSLEYYLEDTDQPNEVKAQLEAMQDPTIDIETIKFLDPSCGSGHILVYAFEVFHKIYLSRGYREREIPQKILENNLFGLDIDKRAAQLATFAVVMKAREYDRRLFGRELTTNIFSIEESNHLLEEQIDTFSGSNNTLKENVAALINVFHDAKLYGSIIQVPEIDIDSIKAQMHYIQNEADITLETSELFEYFYPDVEDLINQYKVLSSKFEIVVTNPPYMGTGNMDVKLKKFVAQMYPDEKSDLFAVFTKVTDNLNKENGYQGTINQQSWMFLSSFEKLRNRIISNNQIINMLHLGTRAFKEIGGEIVSSTSYVLKKTINSNHNGIYVRLVDLDNSNKKAESLYIKNFYYTFNQQDFNKIPGSPIAYWASKEIIEIFFSGVQLENYSNVKQGLIPGNTDVFLKLWYEVKALKIGFNHKQFTDIKLSQKKWFPYNKGGAFRKWYGNLKYIINLENNGYDIKYSGLNNNYRLREPELYFKEVLTWSKISSNKFSLRYLPEGTIFDISGCSMFGTSNKYYILALLNSKVSELIFSLISPTLNFEVQHVKNFPIVENYIKNDTHFIKTVKQNIIISRLEWDSFETSWDFKKHPFIIGKINIQSIEDSYSNWNMVSQERFNQLKENEEELNRIFIDIYCLQDELTPEVEDKDVTVRKADLERDVKSFLSYLIGIMFGRYSPDKEGLIYAGGEWNDSAYKTYKPDEDNLLPITEEAYFEDDLVRKVEELLVIVYSEETLEQNLLFIAEALTKKANESARDRIRRYFQKEFFKDHKQVYKKRPIYWMFSSGKRGAFRGLMYLHRYDKDMIGRLRTEYVLKESKALDNLIALEGHLVNDEATSKKQKAAAQKRIENYQKDKKEIVEYAELLDHLAKRQIELDLDDGVLVNYEKFQGIEVIHPETNKKSKKNSLEKL